MTILNSGNPFGSTSMCGPPLCACESGGDCLLESTCPNDQPCRPDDPDPCDHGGTPPCDPNLDCILEAWS